MMFTSNCDCGKDFCPGYLILQTEKGRISHEDPHYIYAWSEAHQLDFDKLNHAIAIDGNWENGTIDLSIQRQINFSHLRLCLDDEPFMTIRADRFGRVEINVIPGITVYRNDIKT